MTKTINLDGLTSVKIKQSAYDMARFCWIKNLSEADVFASCVNADCTENADEVRRIPAGEFGMIDTESYETLYLNGSGTVEIVTTAFLVCPFGEGKKGGGASLSGSASYTISNAVDYPLLGLSLYGKSVQDGTPTPENPVDIVSIGDSGSVDITVNNGDKSVSATITSALPLCGIPVDSGGNYTDNNGQQWICDELVYNADGTGKIVKRTNGIIFNGSEDWKQGSNNAKMCFVKVDNNIKPKFTSYSSSSYLICNKYISGSARDVFNYIKTCIAVAQDGAFLIYDERFKGDVEGLKADMAANNLRVVYVLDTPQEIELTAAEMAVLRELQTYSGITNISNDSGAEMSVKYCTNKALSEYVLPITKGLQKQIDELKAAVLSLGGNV